MFERKRNSIIKVIIILLILVSVNVFINIPFVSAGRWVYNSTVEDVYNVTISSDDAVAVIDNYFSSSGEAITLKSNIYSSIIGLRFDNISIPHNSTHEYRPVNAYLSLYSDQYPYDPLSEKVTIYFETGNEDIQTYSNYTDLVSRSPSYNYRNWDLDNVHGLDSTTGQWNDSPNIAILVTGATGFDDDTISFLIYSDRGVWFRYFRTIDCFVDYAPRLHIISQIFEYQETPPSGLEGAEFIETYRDFDIWEIPVYTDQEIKYMDAITMIYHNSITGLDGEVDWSDSTFAQTEGGHQEKIAIIDEWVLLVGDNSSTSIYYSNDEFSTVKVSEPNHQFADLDPYGGNYGSIVLDQNDNQTFHIVWSSVTAWQTGCYNIIYANFTILEDGTLSWSSDYVNITNVGTTQYEPDIYSQKDGTLHLVWWGQQGQTYNQVWYMKRYPNGTWGTQVRITDSDTAHSNRADVVANEETGDALIVWIEFVDPDILKWDIVFKNNTDGPDRLFASNARYPSMANDRVNNVAHLAYKEKESPMYFGVEYMYKTIDNSSAWSAHYDVSPDGEKHTFPTLGIDELNETICVVWQNDWIEATAYSIWQIGDLPPIERPNICNRWLINPNQPDYYERYIDLTYYLVTFPDGNILDGSQETVEDARALIDNYLGASSEYDKTPWIGDFTLLLVGLVGVAFIPLGFLIFVSSARDGDIIGGLQTLVLMFFIGIGCIITWLWA